MQLTPELFDALALEGLNVISAARGTTSYEYDITGYQRVPRRNTLRGTFQTWSPQAGESKPVGPHPECALDRVYTVRLGGFERGTIFGPDEIGRLLSENNVLHCDGPGNGTWESALIARKFGLWLNTEVTSWNGKLPVTTEQLASFAEHWEKQAIYVRDCCQRLSDAMGLDLLDDPENLWISLVSLDVQPLDVFIGRVLDNFDEVNADFRKEYGFDLPLEKVSDSPRDVARRIKFWEYVRRRFSEIALVQNNVLRKHVRGRIVGNLEFDTEPDYIVWGQAYDMPGFNMRTALFEDEIGYLHWVGYGVKLSADLTHSAPLISVRTNQVAAGARVIPTREATRYWYSDAIRNGAGGFYLWLQDFPGDTREPEYFGPCMANPDLSTRPQERWETHLDISKALGTTQVFRPPVAETAILVSIPSCAAGAWLDVFSAYVETTRAGIFARFISTAELRCGADPMDGLKLLFVPRAPFEHKSVIARLRNAVEQGLILVVGDAESFQWDEDGEPNTDARRLMGILGVHAYQSQETIELHQDGKQFTVPSYRPGCMLDPAPDARVAGRFANGSAAVVEHAIGRGRVITMGSPLFDLYTSGIRELRNERPERYDVLRHWHSVSGAADHSWVFNVNLDNLKEVTGSVEPARRPQDPSVEFAPFLYVHGYVETSSQSAVEQNRGNP